MTKNGLKSTLMIVVSLVFAIFFMWLALRDLEFEKIKRSLSRANYFWVLVSAFFAILAYVFRAVRWNLLLEPMGYKIRNSNAFLSIAFGYMMNLTIPRSGEVARATALFGVEKIPVEKSFATIVIERVVDLCFMLLFLLLTLIFNGEKLSLFWRNLAGDQDFFDFLSEKLENVNWLMIIAGLLGLMLVGLALMRFNQKILGIVKNIFEGLLSVFKMKERLKFLLYSVGIWGCYFLSAFVVCFALEETAGFGIGDGFLIITAGTLGMMVPTSGGAGSFHFAVKLAIAGIFVSMGQSQEWGEEIGMSYALISHTMQLVCMLMAGLIAMPILIKRKNNL